MRPLASLETFASIAMRQIEVAAEQVLTVGPRTHVNTEGALSLALGLRVSDVVVAAPLDTSKHFDL